MSILFDDNYCKFVKNTINDLRKEKKLQYLPEFENFDKTSLNCRSLYHGYQRGWGIQFGNLKNEISADPIFKFCFDVSKNLSMLSLENRMNLFLLFKYFIRPNTNVVEFGAFKGGNLIFMSSLQEIFDLNITIYGFDTFDGMIKTNKSKDLHNYGDFEYKDFDDLENNIKNLNLNIKLIKGRFKDSLKLSNIVALKNISLAHIDCDIYESCDQAYEYIKSRINPDGYIIFDDPLVSSCLGAMELVERKLYHEDKKLCEQAYPHLVFRGNG